MNRLLLEIEPDLGLENEISIQDINTHEDTEEFEKANYLFLELIAPAILYQTEFINSSYLSTLNHHIHYDTLMKQFSSGIELPYYEFLLEEAREEIHTLNEILDRESKLAFRRIQKFKTLIFAFDEYVSKKNLQQQAIQTKFIRENIEKVEEHYRHISKNTETLQNRHRKDRVFHKSFSEIELDVEYYEKILSLLV
ncbi:MAG: hypothetical protein H7A25_26525 [Leptospiraceae bacterium]|nr:hypothetical protein [Leptospiraceae bacterium]MCP5503483.1 hypothetical protein [Leptospiraceae bacterium]